MFKRVLFATDGSDAALRAAEAIAVMAGRGQEMSVTVAAALGPDAPAGPASRLDNSAAHRAAEEALRATCAVFHLYGIPYNGVVIQGDCACTAITAAAQSDLCDLIAMSSAERPFGRSDGAIPTNVTDEVMQRASVPVLVIPPDYPLPSRRPVVQMSAAG